MAASTRLTVCAGAAAAALAALPLAAAAPADRAADTKPPTVRTLQSQGKHDTWISLLYLVSDDSGRTSETIEMVRGRKVVFRHTTPLATSRAGRLYAYRAKPPPGFRGTLTFCVTARDPSGNTSRRSCAPLLVS